MLLIDLHLSLLESSTTHILDFISLFVRVWGYAFNFTGRFDSLMNMCAVLQHISILHLNSLGSTSITLQNDRWKDLRVEGRIKHQYEKRYTQVSNFIYNICAFTYKIII